VGFAVGTLTRYQLNLRMTRPAYSPAVAERERGNSRMPRFGEGKSARQRCWRLVLSKKGRDFELAVVETKPVMKVEPRS
jgi:hypothetical protein